MADYLAITGGVGGAKLALGLAHVLPADKVAFAVNTGDLVSDGENESHWDDFFDIEERQDLLDGLTDVLRYHSEMHFGPGSKLNKTISRKIIECYTEDHTDKRTIKKGRKGFAYHWTQESFNPITGAPTLMA